MRHPAVSGAFYPSSKTELGRLIEECFAKEAGLPPPAEFGSNPGLVSVVSPHAGFMYSGPVAAFSYREVALSFREPPTFVILGPNHTGLGAPLSLSREDWLTPLGPVKNDVSLGTAILGASNGRIEANEQAHAAEHSIEVQLPFLQFIFHGKEVRFVPICMGFQDYESSVAVAEAVLRASAAVKREILLIASSDFTHFESAESAKRKDSAALAKLKALDAQGFDAAVRAKRATICGHGPIASAIHYARLKGCRRGDVLKYANSGEVTGDLNEVVAYCSAAFRLR